ncbi:MAG TPA: type II CAAX endopeptidase family protein [Gemmatimonadales bacterium]|nr:type II CAAX endopeptidase family protein [Gemmatimonadales bacterium]
MSLTVRQLTVAAAALAPMVSLASPTFVSWAGRRLRRDWLGATLIWALAMTPVVLAELLYQTNRALVISIWGAYLLLALVLAGTAGAPLSPARLLALFLGFALPLSLSVLPPPGQGLLPIYPEALTGIVPANLGLSIVLIYRPTPGFGYRLGLPSRQVGLAIASFAAFGAVAIPLGWLLGFLAPGLGVRSPYAALAVAGIFFFCIALPEELAFRGLLQQSLEQLVGAKAGLLGASLIFGLFHLGHPPSPNWSYALLASMAGLAYGHVYQVTRSITASALTHALVDWTWFAFFAGRGIQ